MLPPSARSQLQMPDPTERIACAFCQERSIGYAATLIERAGKRWRVTVALCSMHRTILASAGDRGRVYGPTRTRYTLLQPP